MPSMLIMLLASSTMFMSVLPQAYGHGAHAAAGPVCACAATESDHPFKIDCSDKSAIATAENKLKTCAKSKTACAAEDANGLKPCQRAFFILQAHHSHCSHETLSKAQEDTHHAYEACVCALELRARAAPT